MQAAGESRGGGRLRVAPGHVHPPLEDIHPLGEALELGEESFDLGRQLITPVLGEAQPLFQGAQALGWIRRGGRVRVMVGGVGGR